MKLKTRIKATLLVAGIVLFASHFVKAQDVDTTKKSKVDFTANVDVYSRYIWRGAQIGTSPSIQPTMKMVVYDKLTLGYWGAYQFDGIYPESDLYVSYALPKGFGVTFTDYFISGNDLAIGDYFEFNDTVTLHTMEGSLTYTGPEKFPLSLLFGYNFYGTDAYVGSMYAEASYPIKNLTLIVGAGNEVYTGKTESDWGIVNVGAKIVKTIKITKDFSLPVTGQLMLNPNSKKLYYAIGISF